MQLRNVLSALLILALSTENVAGAKKKEEDPKECEVCVEVLEGIDALMTKPEKKNKDKIEEAIAKYCGFKSGQTTKKGSLTTKQTKMCYYFDPIKKSISQPFSLGLPKKKVCQRLKTANPEICEVKNTVKVEKTAKVEDVSKLRVKQLKAILAERGVDCDGCLEKEDYVKKVMATSNMDL